ncbi:MAG TPA: hypothetical protein VD707_00165 [Gemmatimonadales bacterium]|nr:hypothetical protein [Gemmatimonadales bacterium]
MRSAGRLALAVTLVAGALADRAAAQRPHRSGLWFELGSGPAAVRVACAGCADVSFEGGSGGYLRVGGVVSDRVLLGVEAFGFDDETFGFTAGDTAFVAETATVAAVALWFPWRSGAFLKGGVGIAEGSFTTTPTPGSPVIAEGVGVGLTFGVGWDFAISRKFAITANAAAFITAIGDLVLPSETVDDVIATMYVVSIGFTVR